MPVRPAGIGRPKADADFEAEVYSLEIPMRPCYVRTSRMARHVVFPTPEVRIMSGIASGTGRPDGRSWEVCWLWYWLSRHGPRPTWPSRWPSTSPRRDWLRSSSTPASTPTPRPGRVPPFTGCSTRPRSGRCSRTFSARLPTRAFAPRHGRRFPVRSSLACSRTS